MERLQNIMKDLEVTPSQDCWKKLSQRLDVVMPQPQSAAQATGNATHAASSASGSILKVVVATLGTAAVVTGITIAVISSHQKEIPTPTQKTNTVLQDTIIPTEDKTDTVSTYPNAPSDKVVDNLCSPLELASLATAATEQNEKAAVAGADRGKSLQTHFTPLALQANQYQIAPISNITLPSVTPISTSAKDDPVVQQFDEETLAYEEPVKLEIPNVFTPNGDGVNDFFIIKGIENCHIRQLTIYNRAGQTVYRSNSYENNWNGDNCADGVYYYQLTTDNHGIQQTLTGSITIIRK